jgi:hypothetical protein
MIDVINNKLEEMLLNSIEEIEKTYLLNTSNRNQILSLINELEIDIESYSLHLSPKIHVKILELKTQLSKNNNV